MTQWARSDQSAVQRNRYYSITSSARASKVGGTVKPSALAVLTLTANTYDYLVWRISFEEPPPGFDPVGRLVGSFCVGFFCGGFFGAAGEPFHTPPFTYGL
jgi:hypothetical protein